MSPTPQWYDADTDDSDRFEEVGTLHGVRIVVDRHLDPAPTPGRAGEAQDECGARHPTNPTAVPCSLAPGHVQPHYSSTGCAGSVMRWSTLVEAHDAQACRDIAAHPRTRRGVRGRWRQVTAINIGDALRVRDASDDWLDAVAVSAPEGEYVDGCKVHDFPVVRVRVMGVDQEMPWPLSDVEVTQ